MKEKLETSNYYFNMNIFGLNKNDLAKCIILYESKKTPVNEILNKIINHKKKVLVFEIFFEMNQFSYEINLEKDYINEISIFMNDNNSNLYNIDFLIQNESSNPPEIKIKYKEEIHKYSTMFNDLNIGKIILLDVDLNLLKISFVKNKNKNDINYEKYKLLQNKRYLDKKETIKDKIINFEINQEELHSKNLLFCLYYFDYEKYTLTIHNSSETIIKNKTKKEIKETDIVLFDKMIIEKIGYLEKILIKENNDLNNFKSFLLEKIPEFDYEKPSSEEDNYLLMIDYFKKYIINSIRTIIKDIIERFFIYYKNPSQCEIDILKKNINFILKKYIQFNEYIKYINVEEYCVKNIKIYKNKLTQKDKIEILSTILTILFSSPIFELDRKIEFINIDNSKNNIYFKAIELFKNIIDKLNTESYYLRGLKQTFSRIRKDLNKLNKYPNKENQVFIIEMRDLESFKLLMKQYLPTKIVRFLNTNSKLNAIYDIYSKNIIINECIFFNRETFSYEKDINNELFDSITQIVNGDIDLDKKENLFNYHLFTFRVFWRIIHEGYGHKPVSIINNNENEIPHNFIINGKFHKISDAGKLLEYFIIDTREDFELLLYQNYDAKTLLVPDLYVDVDFSKFWEKFEQIEKVKENIRKEKNNDSELYLFLNDVFAENKDSCIIEKYVTPRFLWPTHKKLLSII